MEAKYQYTDKCREISGFGGEYEETCRKLVVQGLEWLDKNDGADPQFLTLRNVTGLIMPEGEQAEQLHQAMGVGFEGLTGAMVHYSTLHVLRAKKVGWEKYIEEMESIKD